MITYKNKPVFVLRRCCTLGDEAVLNNIWDTGDYNFSHSRKYTIYPTTKSAVEAKLKTLASTLTSNATLYFSDSSEFPRFKLSDTGYKRCIKIEKADFIVMGKLDLTQCDDCYLFEDEEYIYLIDRNRMYFSYRSEKNKINMFTADPEQYIRTHHLYYGATLTLIHRGTICYSYGGNTDIEHIMNGDYKKIITDEDLDSAINGTFDKLDAETVSSICDMLDSPDKVTKGVGLKILTGYNVQATPLTIRTMLGLREGLSSCPEWKGVGVQQVLSSIGWKGFGHFPGQLWNLLPSKGEENKYTDEDKNLVKDIYMRAVKYFMETAIKQVNDTGIPNTFGLTISYDIKENES